MNQARAAIARFNGPTATTEGCRQITFRVTTCSFSEPAEEGYTFHYWAVARLHRSGWISVEWPGWE